MRRLNASSSSLIHTIPSIQDTAGDTLEVCVSSFCNTIPLCLSILRTARPHKKCGTMPPPPALPAFSSALKRKSELDCDPGVRFFVPLSLRSRSDHCPMSYRILRHAIHSYSFWSPLLIVVPVVRNPREPGRSFIRQLVQPLMHISHKSLRMMARHLTGLANTVNYHLSV